MRSQGGCSSEVAGLDPPSSGSSISGDDDSPGCTSARDSQADLESLAGSDLDPSTDRRGVLSLSERVQVNRSILQHLLKNQDLQTDGDSRPVFVSSRFPRQQQCESRARMKRRCVPLRADHNLLTPAAQTRSGVRLRPVVQAGSEGATFSGHDSDSSSNESALGFAHRRLRFEDETETDVESRYQERQRQRRRSAHQLSGVLASKPDLNLYLERRAAGDPGALGRTSQCNACGTLLGDSNVQPDLDLRGPGQYRVNLWTEPIRETYIGSVVPPDATFAVPRMKVKRRSKEHNWNVLPVNPYSTDPPSRAAPGHVTTPAYIGTSSTTSHQNQQRIRRASVPMQGFSQGEMMERTPGSGTSNHTVIHAETDGQNLQLKATLEGNSSPTVSCKDSDRRVEELTVAELREDNLSKFKSRDESSRLSLRRLFSNVNISKKRSNSLDHINGLDRNDRAKPGRSQEVGEALSESTRPGSRKSPPLLKKSPSVQSLNVGSPFMQLRKSLSVQSFGSLQRKKKDRSENYKPAVECVLQRCLSVDDVGRPSSMRSVGHVLQVCSDGTFLIQLCRAAQEKFGFIISRGRGRSDSGVYVEDMLDSSTEKLYAGLLSIGDEILEVNGEKVACLTLDQVTHLMTRNTSTTVRVLRQWKPPPSR